jgi:hypothetical protein
MKRFVGIVKACAWLDLALIVAWFITLAIRPVVASHIAFVSLAGAAALLVGGMLSAPLWVPLVVLGVAIATGNSILGALVGMKEKLFSRAGVTL